MLSLAVITTFILRSTLKLATCNVAGLSDKLNCPALWENNSRVCSRASLQVLSNFAYFRMLE